MKPHHCTSLDEYYKITDVSVSKMAENKLKNKERKKKCSGILQILNVFKYSCLFLFFRKLVKTDFNIWGKVCKFFFNLKWQMSKTASCQFVGWFVT